MLSIIWLYKISCNFVPSFICQHSTHAIELLIFAKMLFTEDFSDWMESFSWSNKCLPQEFVLFKNISKLTCNDMKVLVLLIEFKVFDNSSSALILEQSSEPLQATNEMEYEGLYQD